MARSKATERDETTHECAIPFAYHDAAADVPRVVRTGEVVRGDDPAYAAAPQYFAVAGTPHAERPRVTDFITTGTPTVAPERRPDGWRRDRHG
jgi:hypothetical protein